MSAMPQTLSAVRSAIVFIQPGTEPPYSHVGEPPPGEPAENCGYERQEVSIADAREFFFAPALESGGFELAEAPTAVRDFSNRDEVVRLYYPELEALALRMTGARRAIVFDHLLRRRNAGEAPATLGQQPGGRPGPAGRAHSDYTEASGQRRLALVLGEEEAARFEGRFAIVNVWRSARGPVLDTPLALCDARSVAPQDLVATELRYPGRKGEIYQLRHNPAQRWAYFSELQPHEAIVFKQYDSGRGAVRFTPHAAFEHPATPPGTPPRESIEARILVLY